MYIQDIILIATVEHSPQDSWYLGPHAGPQLLGPVFIYKIFLKYCKEMTTSCKTLPLLYIKSSVSPLFAHIDVTCHLKLTKVLVGIQAEI